MTTPTFTLRTALLIGVVVASLLVTGCSSDNASSGAATTTAVSSATTITSTTPVPSTLDAADFLEKGNAICTSGNVKIQKAFAGLPSAGTATPAQQDVALEAVLGAVTEQVDQIARLEPPADLAPRVEKFLETARSSIKKARAGGAKAFFANGPDFGEVNAQANDLGLTVCGS